MDEFARPRRHTHAGVQATASAVATLVANPDQLLPAAQLQALSVLKQARASLLRSTNALTTTLTHVLLRFVCAFFAPISCTQALSVKMCVLAVGRSIR